MDLGKQGLYDLYLLFERTKRNWRAVGIRLRDYFLVPATQAKSSLMITVKTKVY